MGGNIIPINPHSAVHLSRELIERYDVSGPRYTSYPTAVQFTDAFDAAAFSRAMRESNSTPIPAPLSLYVHIPFCRQLCFYCACNKLITQDTGKAVDYLRLLDTEAAMYTPLLDGDRRVRQLHLGGGSPTFLNDEQLTQLVESLERHFNLDREHGEWSIEIDPRTVTTARMARLADLGFNRVSFGVQDVNHAVQVAVNRVQSLEQTRQCIAAARQTGMRSVSVDLIYGLPLQTLETFAETLRVVCELAPDRIAIYNYAHLPERFKAQRLIHQHHLPDAATKLAIQDLIRTRLDAAGYVHIGMDHYARPADDLVAALRDGSLQRNFQGYSTHGECELIGLGVSAISAIGGCFAQNVYRLPAYQERIESGQLPVCRGLQLCEDDHLRAWVISQIMCQMKIDKLGLHRRYGVHFDDYFKTEMQSLGALKDDGLITVTPTGYQVTDTGHYFLRNIAMCFDRYNRPDGQFSKVL